MNILEILKETTVQFYVPMLILLVYFIVMLILDLTGRRTYYQVYIALILIVLIGTPVGSCLIWFFKNHF